MTERLDSLPQIHQACWRELERAAHDKLHAWRMMALATVGTSPSTAEGENGLAPTAELRTVVLREVSTDERTLLFFTDARSPKVAQIGAQPSAVLLVWCPQLNWQLRLRVGLQVETAGLAVSSRWARLKMKPAAHDYLSPVPPGSALDNPVPERGTRGYFSIVTATVLAMDWLELHADGQRRALFDATGQGRWLSP